MVIKSFDAATMGAVHGTTLYQISEQRGGDGELCLTVDYEALKADRDAQQKRADALAVENAGLKKFCKDAAFDADYESEIGMERGGFTDSLNNIETTATDAALAAIEARGVEKAIYLLLNKFSGTGHIGVPVMVLESLANELREAK